MNERRDFIIVAQALQALIEAVEKAGKLLPTVDRAQLEAATLRARQARIALMTDVEV